MNSAVRRRRLLGATVLGALCLSGCGGSKQETAPPPPALPRAVGDELAGASEDVAAALAAGDSCRALTLARRLQTTTIAAINARRVPTALQEQLSSSVNALVARVRCVPPPQQVVPMPPADDHGKHKGRKKHDRGDKKEDGD